MFKEFEKELRLRGFSKRTIESYLFFNKKFIDFIRKNPRNVDSIDIKTYINYLMEERNAKPRTINLAISSLKFYYDVFMNKRLFFRIKRQKEDKRLPTVLSMEEIKAMLENEKNLKHKLLIEFLYSSGLRVSECIKLRVNDIYFGEKIGIVRKGKGSKDRYFILSERVADDLKKYLRLREKKKIRSSYIFENYNNGHITTETAEKIVKKAAKNANIAKNVYPHALRASFATHLLESGIDKHYVQKLLGHSRSDTVERYLNTGSNYVKGITSPLDMLK